MVVSSLIAAALTLAVLVFVVIRLFGHGDVPYFTPSRRVRVTASALELPGGVMARDVLARPRRRRV